MSIISTIDTASDTTQSPAAPKGLKLRTKVRAGWGPKCNPPCGINHGLKLRTKVRAGWGPKCNPPCGVNHGLRMRRGEKRAGK